MSNVKTGDLAWFMGVTPWVICTVKEQATEGMMFEAFNLRYRSINVYSVYLDSTLVWMVETPEFVDIGLRKVIVAKRFSAKDSYLKKITGPDVPVEDDTDPEELTINKETINHAS